MKGLILLIVLALVAASCGNDANAPATPTTDPTVAPTNPRPTPTPQSMLLPAERDTHAVIRQIEVDLPAVTDLVATIESEDIPGLLGYLAASEATCDTVFYRGRSACEVYDVAAGTLLHFVAVGEFSGGVLRSQAEERFEDDLAGKSPSLELVAWKQPDILVLIFDLEGDDPGQFVVEFDGSTVLRATSRQNVMPLDFVRVAEASGADVYGVLAAADSFHAKEAAFIEDSLRNNTALPFDYPWYVPGGGSMFGP